MDPCLRKRQRKDYRLMHQGQAPPTIKQAQRQDREPATDDQDWRLVWHTEKSASSKERSKDLHYNILNNVDDGLQVVDIANKGRGVIATKEFKRGEFVVEYAGDLISLPEAKEREEKYRKDPTKGCYVYHFYFKGKRYCIDATEETGKLGRLLNHSKTAGNCHTKLVDVNNHPYLILAASRDIKSGEELLYDYGDRSKDALEAHPWLKS